MTILAGACAFILFGAFKRLAAPEIVSGKIVIYIAAVGILGNGFSAWLLHRDSKYSLNVRGAFLHMMRDFLTSVVVLINGVVLVFKPWYWLDPLLSVLVVIFILKNCWSILKSSTMILMNATPSGIDKIIHPQAFAQAVFNYQLLPDGLVNLTALVLPWLELVLGGCLIFNRWMPGAVIVSIALLSIFMGAILFNLS